MEDKIKLRTGRDPQRRRHCEIREVPAACMARPRGGDAKEVAAWENRGKTETWKAKEEMAAESGGGSEDHAGQKMVGEGGV
jgi:hypothetical protein